MSARIGNHIHFVASKWSEELWCTCTNFSFTVKPVLSDHINKDMFLAFLTDGCLLLHESSAVVYCCMKVVQKSSCQELSALLSCSNKQPPANSSFHITLMGGGLNRFDCMWAATWENRIFAYVKTKMQISFAVTAKLISVFVFGTRIVQSFCLPNPKFQVSSHLLWLYSPVCVGPGRKPWRPVFWRRGPCYIF